MWSRFKPFPVFLALCLGAGAKASGLLWNWANPLPHGNNVVGLAYYAGLTIQIADLGQLYTSDDLQLWTPRPTGTTNSLQATAVYGNRLVVSGANGTMLYSDDGVTYVHTNLATTDWLVGLAASTNLVIAVGDEAAIYTSGDGAVWARQKAPPNVGGNWLQGAAYGAGLFVAVGEGGYIATSPNGTNWTQRSVSGTSFANNLNSVAWIDTPGGAGSLALPGFLAVSDLGEAIISTNGGTNWFLEKNFSTTNSLYGVSGNNNSRLVAGDSELDLGAGASGHISWKSQIGSVPGTALAWSYYCSLWATNPPAQYLVAGDSGMMLNGVETNGIYSWNQLANSPRSWLWQVTTNAGLYVAVGDQAAIMTSGDGVNWSTEAIPYTNSVSVSNTVFFGVGGDTNLLIAVGNAGTIVVSTNSFTAIVTTNLPGGGLTTNTVSTIGVVWRPVPPPTTNDLQGVGFWQNQYYVCGGSGTILRSSNGLSWTGLTTPTTAFLSGLASFPGGLVAVGDTGIILTSPDGSSWTARASGTTNWLFRVRYLGGVLIAVGENGAILTSTNATTWQQQVSDTSEWLNDVQMVANSFFIVGNDGTVLAGANSTTWTNVPVITGKSLYGAATQNGQLVVAGIEGVILQSQVAPVLTPVEILDFSRAPNAVLFLVGGQPDQQFTLDSSTNLTDWTTGSTLEMTESTLLFYETTGANPPTNQFYRTTLLAPP